VHISIGAGKSADGIADILTDEAGDAAFPADGASGLQFAASTIGDMASIYANLAGAFGAAIAERLVRGAAIGIGLAIIAKGIPGEEGVALAAAIDDRDVRNDFSVDQPAKQWAAAIRFVSRKAFGCDAQRSASTRHECPGRRDLGCEARRRRLHIKDAVGIEVEQRVDGICVPRRPVLAGERRLRVGRRDAGRIDRRWFVGVRRQRGIERRQIFSDRSRYAVPGTKLVRGIGSLQFILAAGVGHDRAAVHRHVAPRYQPGRGAPSDHLLEQ